MSVAQHKRWWVTAAPGAPLDEIARQLTDAGFQVDDVLTAIGCITGSAEPAVAERIRSIPGVTDVSEEPVVNVGPPEGDQPM
jgi:hypothetical protein